MEELKFIKKVSEYIKLESNDELKLKDITLYVGKEPTLDTYDKYNAKISYENVDKIYFK